MYFLLYILPSVTVHRNLFLACYSNLKGIFNDTYLDSLKLELKLIIVKYIKKDDFEKFFNFKILQSFSVSVVESISSQFQLLEHRYM